MDRFCGLRVAVQLTDGSVRRAFLYKITKYEVLLGDSVIQKHSIVSVTAETELEKAGA
jgi:hypothetical protein